MDSSTKKSSSSYFCVSKKEVCKTNNSTSIWVVEANQGVYTINESMKNVTLYYMCGVE